MADVNKLQQRPEGRTPAVGATEVEPTGRTGRVDGRTLRRTNRTVTFATKVTQAFDDRVRAIAQRDGILLVEVLERALDALERQG